MAELDSKQTAVTLAAIQAAMMALKEADIGPTTGTNMANVGGTQT